MRALSQFEILACPELAVVRRTNITMDAPAAAEGTAFSRIRMMAALARKKGVHVTTRLHGNKCDASKDRRRNDDPLPSRYHAACFLPVVGRLGLFARASISATMSDISQSRGSTPAAIAGDMRKVVWAFTKLQQAECSARAWRKPRRGCRTHQLISPAGRWALSRTTEMCARDGFSGVRKTLLPR